MMVSRFRKPLLAWAAVLVLLLACSTLQSRQSEGIGSADPSPSPPGDLSLDYVLLVELSLEDGEGGYKEQGVILFRGPLVLKPDGTIQVENGRGSVEGTFRCVDQNLDSASGLLGPGEFSGTFEFQVRGQLAESEEYAEMAVEIMDLVPLSGQDDIPAAFEVGKFFFPDGYSSPQVNIEGLDTSRCMSGDTSPASSQWVVGLSGVIQGDGGATFENYVFLPLYAGAARQLNSLNPEIIDSAVLCLAEPGEACRLD